MTNTNTNNSVEEKLIGIGCDVWEKYGRKRIYINTDEELEKVFGLLIHRECSWWIEHAFLKGKKLSNYEVRCLLGNGPYYDCIAGKYVSKLAPVEFFAA